MSRAPELTGEEATQGDPYALVVKVLATSLGSKVFAAQARSKVGASGSPLATFAIDAVNGTGGDTGNIVVTASLTGTQTRSLPGVVECDLQYTDSGATVTLLRWKLRVFGDVTR